MQELVKRVLAELSLNYKSKEQIVYNYATYIIDKTLDRSLNIMNSLQILINLPWETKDEDIILNFSLLYWAKGDLETCEEQWYWPDATRSNIDDIILMHLKKWKNDLNP